MQPPQSTSLHAKATTVAAGNGPLITFLVASSLISIHPSTCVIDITLASLPTDFPVIVALGKLQTNTNDTDAGRYAEYETVMRRRAQGRPNLRIVREPTNSGGEKLIGSLRHAIKSVQTPYTCSVQHDLAYTAVRSIDFEAIVADMQNATFQMKLVRTVQSLP